MPTGNSTGILAVRAAIIIIALFGCALVWVLSEPLLPQSFLGLGFRVGVCAWVFLHAWDYSKRIGEPEGWLNRVLTDRAYQIKPASAPMTDAASPEIRDIDDEFFAQVAGEMKQDFMDGGSWAKACALSQGDELRQRSFYIELRARKLFKEHEAEVRRTRETDELNRKAMQEDADKLHQPEQAKRRNRLALCAGLVTFCGMAAPGIGQSALVYALELRNLLIGVFYIGWVVIAVAWWRNHLWLKSRVSRGET